jgi:hypothetical protein
MCKPVRNPRPLVRTGEVQRAAVSRKRRLERLESVIELPLEQAARQNVLRCLTPATYREQKNKRAEHGKIRASFVHHIPATLRRSEVFRSLGGGDDSGEGCFEEET